MHRIALLVACATQPAARQREQQPEPSARVIVDLEARFAAASRQKGARTAFLEFLADDSIVLQPGPVWGRAAWESASATDASEPRTPPDRTRTKAAALAYTTVMYKILDTTYKLYDT